MTSARMERLVAALQHFSDDVNHPIWRVLRRRQGETHDEHDERLQQRAREPITPAELEAIAAMLAPPGPDEVGT